MLPVIKETPLTHKEEKAQPVEEDRPPYNLKLSPKMLRGIK
jgi:hypothetical protein